MQRTPSGRAWRDQMCGAIGDIGCFSFFANKNLSTAEGGMIVTNNDRLAERIRLLRSHGMTTLTWDRHQGHAHSYDVVERGFNYRLDELRAAIGLVELRRLRERNAARARIVEQYRAELHGIHGLQLPFRDDEIAAHHLAVVVLPDGCSRDALRARLTSSGIQTSVHYPPIHRFSYYQGLGARRRLPVTEEVADRLVTLPLYPHMRDVDVSAVTTAALKAISEQGDERSPEATTRQSEVSRGTERGGPSHLPPALVVDRDCCSYRGSNRSSGRQRVERLHGLDPDGDQLERPDGTGRVDSDRRHRAGDRHEPRSGAKSADSRRSIDAQPGEVRGERHLGQSAWQLGSA